MSHISFKLDEATRTIVDYADELFLHGWAWRPLEVSPGKFYAHAWRNKMHVYMHRLIIGAGPRDYVDHINGDGLDNRRINLRLATPSQNSANRAGDNRKAGVTSVYKGVSWNKTKNKWAAYIHVSGKTRSLGAYVDELDAARAYDKAAAETWGEFARLNLPSLNSEENFA